MITFPDGDREARDAHIEAVRAQCTVSPEYALALLALHEVELTSLLELALELDDQAPKP